MKTQKIAIAISGIIVVALVQSPVLAQQPVITSFHGNGKLMWTNPPGSNAFTVQWTPTVTGPWSSNWLALDSLITTSSQTTVSVPMFYRVAQGFSLASMHGTWIMSDLTTGGNNYFIAQDDGILSECSMLNPSRPVGYFSVGVSGRVTNTFVFTGGTFTSTGTFSSANLINPDPPYANLVMRRLEDPSRCAGNWTGTLSQTNGPGMPASHPVSLRVDTRGLVSNFTGFTGVAIGRMFALANGAAAGSFITGTESDNGVYWEISISGTLTGNTFSGSYETDSGIGSEAVLGTVSLTRQ
ncbi:MAG: hypothetical protein NT154_43650 [Verrucomicrobia bacterium]|nr:hypothetical protein [Verrucomicrobiota bacterium]